MYGAGDVDTESFQIMIAGKLVECKCAYKHSTRGIRHSDHIEISLQTSVFSRSTVDRNIGKIKMSDLAILTETKIILIYWCVFPAGKFYRPFISFYDGNIYIIFIFIKKREDSFRTF